MLVCGAPRCSFYSITGLTNSDCSKHITNFTSTFDINTLQNRGLSTYSDKKSSSSQAQTYDDNYLNADVQNEDYNASTANLKLNHIVYEYNNTSGENMTK